MRILAIADLHYDDDTCERAKALAAAVCEAQAEVLIIAGDCTADGADRLGEVLALFDRFDGERLMVPGNHDLWEHQLPFGTWSLYEETIPAVANDCGFHCLDSGPKLIGRTAFVGSMGWYDYEMRQIAPPLEQMSVAPIEVSRAENGKASFRAVAGAEEKRWQALEAADYAANGLIWQSGGRPQVAVWNDALHLDWQHEAAHMTEFFSDRISAHLEEVADSCERTVGVTHFVPFRELADHDFERPGRAFARAYLGSASLGQALLQARNLELVIYGHRHLQEVREVAGVVTADASVKNGEGPLLLTLPD